MHMKYLCSLMVLTFPRIRNINGFAGRVFGRRHRSQSTCIFAERDSLESIESKISNLLEGRIINLNSPKQVSLEIFGQVQKADQDTLLRHKNNDTVSENSRYLADLVLQWRQQKQTMRSQAPQVSPAASPKDNIIALEPSDMEGLSEHERKIYDLFRDSKCMLSEYWREPLLSMTRPTARSLALQLDSSKCPMGFDPNASPFDRLKTNSAAASTAGKKGTFLAFCREEKVKHPDSVLLVRCGDFYEAYGIDAIMLVEHAGLNPMAGKAKAGCPYRNVQATIDCLVEKGFSVAVYEEGTDTDASVGRGASAGSKSRIKSRFLAQIVSAASPTYMYDLVLSGTIDSLSSSPSARPYVGVISQNSGYTMVEVAYEERNVGIIERLTAEGVACRLSAFPAAEPILFFAVSGDTSTSFLPNTRGDSISPRVKVLPKEVFPEEAPGISDVERARTAMISSLSRLLATDGSDHLDPSEFSIKAPRTIDDANQQLQPLHMETACQMGLMNDPAIPSLVSSLVPQSAPVAVKRFLRRWLLNPPSPDVSKAMSDMVEFYKFSNKAVDSFRIPPLGKVLALLRAGQASAEVYRELVDNLRFTLSSIASFRESDPSGSMIEAFEILISNETGISAKVDMVDKGCEDTIREIQSVVSHTHALDESYCEDLQKTESISHFGSVVPPAFFDRNEVTWRGRVRETAAQQSYSYVESKARQLAEAVAEDFWGQPLETLLSLDQPASTFIVQDIFNNRVYLKSVPDHGDKAFYFHPKDRNGKTLSNRFTTARVQDCMLEYIDACEKACNDVSQALSALSERLFSLGHIPTIVQSSHASLVLGSAYYHAVQINTNGWNKANVLKPGDVSPAHFAELWPYWMKRREAVPNTFDLEGMWILTAPNMAGKSTLMRSTGAAALLASCGLNIPGSPGSYIAQYDYLFVRGASTDVPMEGKSAFGAEMNDMAAILRLCGRKSLVLVDEIGRGTSPHDGTRIAGAILEAMTAVSMNGIFSTHLHDVLGLPLNGIDKIAKKRMAWSPDGDDQSSYVLEDGICTNSLALATAARFGLPEHVLKRADELSNFESQNVDVTPKTDSAVDIAETITSSEPLEIPAGSLPAASLDGQSAVYILELDSVPPRLYVGETDNFRLRIAQHRSKGMEWMNASAVAFIAPEGKSQARSWESLLIRTFLRKGFNLESIEDGRRLRP